MSECIVFSNTKGNYHRVRIPSSFEFEIRGELDGVSWIVINQIDCSKIRLFNNMKTKRATISGFTMSNTGFEFNGEKITPIVYSFLDSII